MNRLSLKCFRILLANLLWLVSALPGWVRLLVASRSVKSSQLALLFKIIHQQARTAYGGKYRFDSIRNLAGFDALPLTEYEDYVPFIDRIRSGESDVLTADPVELLHPTSGSSGAMKLVPYTKALRCSFKAAIDPWIASLYMNHPELVFRTQYWSVSPNSDVGRGMESRVRIGFMEDVEYLGRSQRSISGCLFAVPSELSGVRDNEAFLYLTLLFLVRDRNLGLISVWHPSFLTILMDALKSRLPLLIHDVENGRINDKVKISGDLRSRLERLLRADSARAAGLSGINTEMSDYPQVIWPHVAVISCWDEGTPEPWLMQIRQFFPRAAIQGKGLAATEGIVSFPFGPAGMKICAPFSHFLEFADAESGRICRLWEVEKNRIYSVIITTGGGLYRYRLHDSVKVTGFFNQFPCLSFLGRDNLVCDFVGEKLNSVFVQHCIEEVQKHLDVNFSFAMLAPSLEGVAPAYVLYAGLPDGSRLDCERVAVVMESELSRNFHYSHARQLSQLGHVRVCDAGPDAGIIYRDHLMRLGTKSGGIKFAALSAETCWADVFGG